MKNREELLLGLSVFAKFGQILVNYSVNYCTILVNYLRECLKCLKCLIKIICG